MPTTQEINTFDDIDEVFNTLWDTAIDGQFPPYIDNPMTGNPIGNNFGAYDVIGNRVLAIALFNQINDSFSNRVLTALEALEVFSSIFEVIGLNYTLTITITFPDGSIGIMRLDEHGEMVFDDSSFIDADGNPIPFTAADAEGRTYHHPGGSGSGSYLGLISRLRLLGAGGRFSCSGECDAAGCTTTCIRH